MIATEMAHGGYSRERIIETMEKSAVMKQSVAEGIAGVTSVTGLTGGDATRLNDYIYSGNFLSGGPFYKPCEMRLLLMKLMQNGLDLCYQPQAVGSFGVGSY